MKAYFWKIVFGQNLGFTQWYFFLQDLNLDCSNTMLKFFPLHQNSKVVVSDFNINIVTIDTDFTKS